MVLIKIKQLEKLINRVFSKLGVPTADRKIIIDSIIIAHQRGKGSHGIGRVNIYARKIREGLMSASTVLKTMKDTPVVSVFDAAHGFGQVAAWRGTETAIEKASKYGVGLVGIKSSNNFGTAGFIVEQAAQKEMIGVVLANSGPAIAPTGGNKPLFGTNPIGIAFPVGEGKPPIILDMATSNAARGKIRLAAANGELIPEGWALDANGNPTTHPLEALKGSMIPIGGHKGYGLSLAVDILAGLLTGAAFAGDVKPLNHKSEFSEYGHFIMAINIRFFLEYNEYLEKITYLTKKVKASGLKDQVFLPGEKSYQLSLQHKDHIEITEKQLKDINDLARLLEIDTLLVPNQD